jgi:hypothetical protein
VLPPGRYRILATKPKPKKPSGYVSACADAGLLYGYAGNEIYFEGSSDEYGVTQAGGDEWIVRTVAIDGDGDSVQRVTIQRHHALTQVVNELFLFAGSDHRLHATEQQWRGVEGGESSQLSQSAELEHTHTIFTPMAVQSCSCDACSSVRAGDSSDDIDAGGAVPGNGRLFVCALYTTRHEYVSANICKEGHMSITCKSKQCRKSHLKFELLEAFEEAFEGSGEDEDGPEIEVQEQEQCADASTVARNAEAEMFGSDDDDAKRDEGTAANTGYNDALDADAYDANKRGEFCEDASDYQYHSSYDDMSQLAQPYN